MFASKSVEFYLENLQDPRRAAILAFHGENLTHFNTSMGSSGNHQGWVGGYRDHLTQCLNLVEILYTSLPSIPFSRDSAIIVLYFHDLEKMWKYTTGELIDKNDFFDKVLGRKGVDFSEDERNALKFVHGEGDLYSKQERGMLPLAAFCHACDVISARIYFGVRELPTQQG